MMTPLDAALDYIARGWNPTPVEPRDKKPVLTDWPKTVIDAANAAALLQPARPQCRHRARRAVARADRHRSRLRRSVHRRALVPAADGRALRPSIPTRQPLALSSPISPPTRPSPAPRSTSTTRSSKAEGLGWSSSGSAALRGRADRLPAVHPQGHRRADRLVERQRSATADRRRRRTLARTRKLAAATLLGRYWPQRQGTGGHNAARLLGGLLRRAGWSEAEIAVFVEAIARAGGDPDVKDRVRSARDAAAGLRRRQEDARAADAGEDLRQGSRRRCRRPGST